MKKVTIRTVNTGLGEISYELERKRIKRLNLHVRRNQSVYLSVPYNTSYAYADKFVTENAGFVFASIEKIAKKTALDTLNTCFLGEPLKIIIQPSEKLGGELSPCEENTLTLFLPSVVSDKAESEVLFKKALELWQKEQAKTLLPRALDLAYKRFEKAGLKVPYPKLSVRSMTSRWGSCAVYKNKITLNSGLVEKPFVCMEQVACHELAHFIVQNHSADFYRVLDIVMPEHRQVNRILKKG